MTAPNGGFTTPQQPQNQFGQTAPQMPPQGWQPQQPQNQQQPAPGQQPAPAGLDMNARLSGPSIPQELQGKTVGEALRYYGVMRQDFINRNYSQNNAQQPQGQAPQAQPQQQPQQQFAPRQQNGQYAPQQQTQAPAFQPTEDSVRRIAQEAAAAAMAPVAQVSAGTVYDQVSRSFPDWAQYDAEIRQTLANPENPSVLLNPEIWKSAYFLAKGKALSEGRVQQPQVGPQNAPVNQYGNTIQSPPQPVQQPQYQQPYQGQPQYQQPAQPQQVDQWGRPIAPPPQPQQYFVESPTPTPPQAPAFGTQQPGAPGPQDEIMARRFGMSVDAYRQWKGGNVPPMQAPAQPIYAPAPAAPSQWVNNGR